jgi:hypothetical protein
MCGMCPANAELEVGDPEAPVDFLCQVAHLRALALGISVPSHGNCEYCVNGAKRGILLRSLASLQKSSVPPFTISENGGRILPILNGETLNTSSSAAGGCTECDAASVQHRTTGPHTRRA